MEDKLSALESLGAVKELVNVNNWNELYESGLNSISAIRKLFHSRNATNLQVFPNEQIKERKTVVTLLKQTFEVVKFSKCHHHVEEFIPENLLPNLVEQREVEGTKQELKRSCPKMEINKPDTVVSDKHDINKNNKVFCIINSSDCSVDKNFQDVNSNNQKTEKCDNLNYSNSNVTSSECHNLNKINFNVFNGYDESFEVEAFHNEIIPKLSDKKVSSSVQEWVNHLPTKSKIERDCTEFEDFKNENSEIPIQTAKEDAALVAAKLSRETSVQSSSSLESLLDSRRPDPVEIFLNLGFGGVPGVDMEHCRIPKRFLVPSKCKGGDWNEFLKRELIQAQNFECSSLGFRGLSGPSYRRPSAIVANIMEKLRERTIPSTQNKSRFSAVARRVLNEKSVLNKLTSDFQSVLSPDNRKFLQNQGKKSPEVPRRRIIFGQKSFAFAHDGEFIEVESAKCHSGPADNDSMALSSKSIKDDNEDSKLFPNSDILLKLRRSSLQKQKKIDEDSDVDDIYYVVGKDGKKGESDRGSFESKTSRKTGKIPRRFLSSSNLKILEKENDFSETMRLEVEKEIRTLSERIKSISDQDLPSVLKQVKELTSRLESTTTSTISES